MEGKDWGKNEKKKRQGEKDVGERVKKNYIANFLWWGLGQYE